MNDILKELGVNEKYSKPVKIKKQFSMVKDNIPLKADYNFMADLLELPETKKGFKYLLVVVDLATDEFDIEPITNNKSLTVFDAMKRMFKRKHIKKPYASIRTDGGAEFKDAFDKYCYENNILHKIGVAGRHQQTAKVERLNRELGRLIIGYLNSVEEKTFKDYKEWVEIVPKVRTMLNDFRKKPEGDPFTDIYPTVDLTKQPKYKEGDVVYRMSEKPLDALGRKQPTQNFRMGDYRWDIMPRKIIRVLRYAGKVPIRYILENLPNVAYAEYELMPANEKDALYIVESVKAKRTIRGVKQLLIKWKGYKKTEWQDYNQIKAQIPNIDKLYKRS
jgi:hypothetical protein